MSQEKNKIVALIFPHQLFEKHPALIEVKEIYLIEDPLFFGDFKYPIPFHKKKLILHRASMKNYAEKLKKNFKVSYIDYKKITNKPEKFYKKLAKNYLKFNIIDPTDYILKKRLKKYLGDKKINWYNNPNFLNTTIFNQEFFKHHKKYRLTEFYIHQRKQYQILIDKNEKPIGGKWTFDTANRKKLPKDIRIPPIYKGRANIVIEEATKYVNKNFKSNPGSSENFFYPINSKQAKDSFHTFLKERFEQFGPYQDAITQKSDFTFHSILTPALNIGLINPDWIIKETLEFSEKNKIPINSLEGFIRQILGWREFMRAMYEIEGVSIRNANHFKHKKKMPAEFWDGNTGIKPIDDIIRKILKTAYAHHIERLMVLGNIMLLLEIDPNEVYRWFMSLFIDSYDWVMVPNVYSMSQYADGGLLTTKPYISSSNYILKMSDYKKEKWCEKWTELFWEFMKKHRQEFKKNPRLALLLKNLDKK